MRVITIPFEQRYSDNVIAELRGVEEPSKIIVLSAHYDSRSTSAQVTQLKRKTTRIYFLILRIRINPLQVLMTTQVALPTFLR